MQIQLFILLYTYLAFLIIWLAFSVTAVYHVFKFGFRNFVSYASVVLYIAVSTMILGASFFYIIQFDWNTKLLNIDNSGSVITGWE